MTKEPDRDNLQSKAEPALEPGKHSKDDAQELSGEHIEIPCCSELVHIAYRGKADDRLYLAYNRSWQELKFYQANGLRVFCATCRSRVY